MTREQVHAQMLRDTLRHADTLMASLPQYQYMGVLITEAEKGNLTAKHLLLSYQHALAQVDEAERLAFTGEVR